ncbi:MAG: histidine kinase [Chloroflexi bacterium HGW-Chloroflexi-10]|nr:MAG: histidine kinase [Chloroflexi bacterium HGW-Chloroflexi-10]
MLKQHTVRNWMNDLVVFVDGNQTVTEALSLMRRRYINSVMVRKTDENSDYGIVTTRDICDKIVASGVNPKETLIKNIMSSPVVTVKQNSSIEDCALLMKEKHIHHLPVINDHGEVVGMISASDFLLVAEAMGNNFEERSLS